MDGKLAVVCSGGGMRCAYASGAVVALAKEHGLTSPDILIAASGSVGSSFYYLAGQYDSPERIWTELLSTPQFISYLRPWRVMNIDYLVDRVFKEQEPLHVDAVRRSLTAYYVPVTDADTGTVRYITKEDGIDEFELLRATKAIPYLYGKKVALNGREYIDGYVGTDFAGLLHKAEDLGATRIIAVDCGSHFREDPPEKVGVNRLIIRPYDLDCHRLTRNADTLRRAFERGYADMAAATLPEG